MGRRERIADHRGLGLPRHRWGPAVKTRLITPGKPERQALPETCQPASQPVLYMADWSLPTHKRVRSAPRRSPSNQGVMSSSPTVPASALDASRGPIAHLSCDGVYASPGAEDRRPPKTPARQHERMKTGETKGRQTTNTPKANIDYLLGVVGWRCHGLEAVSTLQSHGRASDTSSSPYVMGRKILPLSLVVVALRHHPGSASPMVGAPRPSLLSLFSPSRRVSGRATMQLCACSSRRRR